MTPGTVRTISRMTSRAPGTVMVTSIMGMPPWATSSTAKRASSADEVLIEGTRPTSSTRFLRSSLFMAEALPKRPAGGAVGSDYLVSIIEPRAEISSDSCGYVAGMEDDTLRQEAAKKHVTQKKKSAKAEGLSTQEEANGEKSKTGPRQHVQEKNSEHQDPGKSEYRRSHFVRSAGSWRQVWWASGRHAGNVREGGRRFRKRGRTPRRGAVVRGGSGERRGKRTGSGSRGSTDSATPRG